MVWVERERWEMVKVVEKQSSEVMTRTQRFLEKGRKKGKKIKPGSTDAC